MATPSMTLNPMLTTNAPGSFGLNWDGYIQGMVMDDPAARFSLAGGYLDPAETLPMWGGVGITEYVPLNQSLPLTPNQALGGPIRRATRIPIAATPTIGDLSGFSVYNQAHHMIQGIQTPAPVSGSYMGVHFHRLGSGARIPLLMDPALVSLGGLLTSSLVSWDFAAQRISQYVAPYASNVFTAATWLAGVATFTTTTAHGVTPGSSVTIAGVTPAGYNGTFIAGAGTAGSTINVPMAVNPGASTIQGALQAGGGALPGRILDIAIGNCITVQYDPVTNFATWNRAGSCALFLLQTI